MRAQHLSARVAALGVVGCSLVLLSACEAILGLGGESALGDAGSADGTSADRGKPGRDAASEEAARPEAGLPPGAAIQVASGWGVSTWCVVTKGADVLCWGNNESGELGDGTQTPRVTPRRVPGLPPASSVTVGTGTTCALTRAGGVECWGYDADGELGDGTTAPFSTSPKPAKGLESGVTAVSSGYFASCAIRGGALYCWGYGGNGLLGIDTNDAVVPTKVPGLEDGVDSVAVGGNGACATRKGSAYCWGSAFATAVPVMVQFPDAITAITTGEDFACGLTVHGGVQCFGDGSVGALGNGQLGSSPTPVQVTGLESGVLAIAAAQNSMTALLTDGTVMAWGYAAYGDLGNGTADLDTSAGPGLGGYRASPAKVDGLPAGVVSITGGDAPCVATSAGTVECWGRIGQNALVPVRVLGPSGFFTSVTTGGAFAGEFSCGTFSDGTLECWGDNRSGQLGIGTSSPYSAVAIAGAGHPPAKVTAASQESDFACSVASGLAYCWGDNSDGQLGTGKVGGSSGFALPVVNLTGTVLSIAAGEKSACAIVSTGDGGATDGGAGGALYCWGDNSYGQLGLGAGSGASHPSPKLVPTLSSGVTAVALGPITACALVSDGGVFCWGDDTSGQLGDGDPSFNQKDAPTAVMGLPGPASAISVGLSSACAVVAGGALCWGYDGYGELGAYVDAGAYYYSSLLPVQVQDSSGLPLSGVTQVSVGAFSACAVASGGAVCWGTGPLGNDSVPTTTAYAAGPVQGLASGVAQVAVTAETACAVVAGGAIVCWGFNHFGALGDNGALDALTATRMAGFP